MKIIPFYQFTYISKKKPNELSELINSHCSATPINVLAFELHPKSLLGQSNANTFKIYRNIAYRNSFLPIAFGVMHVEQESTVIELKMKMHFLVNLFLIFYFSSLMFVFSFLLFQSAPAQVFLGIILLFLTIYVLVQVCFWIEVDKLQRILESMF